MYLGTSLYTLLCKAALTPDRITLDTGQKLYGYLLISVLNKYSVKKILPISL